MLFEKVIRTGIGDMHQEMVNEHACSRTCIFFKKKCCSVSLIHYYGYWTVNNQLWPNKSNMQWRDLLVPICLPHCSLPTSCSRNGWRKQLKINNTVSFTKIYISEFISWMNLQDWDLCILRLVYCLLYRGGSETGCMEDSSRSMPIKHSNNNLYVQRR